MVEPLPTFDEVREQMRSPKPPVACRVVEFDHGEVRRSATVLFDGLQGWYIDDGTQVEVRGSDECVLFDSDGTLERVGPGLGYVHSNAWAKTPIEPRRMLLDEARGRVLRRDEVNAARSSSWSSAASSGPTTTSRSRCRSMLRRG
jgi:hypothetical protein